jgi:hypothetical protein
LPNLNDYIGLIHSLFLELLALSAGIFASPIPAVSHDLRWRSRGFAHLDFGNFNDSDDTHNFI